MSKTNKKQLENLNEKLNTITEQTEKILQKLSKQDESFEYYTEQEIEYLDKFKNLSGDALDEEELYDIIIKHNFDDKSIKKEVEQAAKLVKRRGEEYGWTKIENGKKAKIEKVKPEVILAQSSTKPSKYGNKMRNTKFNDGQNKTEVERQYVQEIEERNDIEKNYLEQDRGYNYNYQNYYGYNNYRPNRGKNYHRGRGSQRGRGRGRSQNFNNRNYFNEEELFKHHFGNNKEENVDDLITNKVKEIELKEEEKVNEELNSLIDMNKFSTNNKYEDDKIQEENSKQSAMQSKINNQSRSYTNNNLNDENKSHTLHLNQNTQTQNKTTHQTTYKDTASMTQHRTKSTHTDAITNSHQKKTTHNNQSNKHNSSDDDTGVFSTKDIPSNIRANIKDLIEENDSSPKKNKFSNVEFTVDKISISIDNEQKFQTNNQNQNKQYFDSNNQHKVSNTNFFVPQTTKNPAMTNTTGVNSNKTIKKGQKTQQVISSHIGDVNEMSQTNPSDYQQVGYQMPLPMRPMGFYIPQPLTYDNQNQMGSNNPMYQMMPMYYYPYISSTVETDDNSSHKTKKMGFNNNLNFGSQMNSNKEINQQMNQGGVPNFTPFYYYNPQNPYNQMGINMGVPGMGMMNSHFENNQNYSENYELKNMKNTKEEQNPNFYGYNFYKQ